VTAADDMDLEAWVRAHGDALFGFARARLRDRGDAEDAVQETFLAALAGRGHYSGRSGERAWLFGILRHKVVDRLRERGRQTPLESGEHADAILEQAFDHSGHWRLWPQRWPRPDEGLEQDQFRRVLATCLGALPSGLQAAFRLVELDGTASGDACKVLGISPNNLWVRLHRARLRLRECLELRWFRAPADAPGRRA